MVLLQPASRCLSLLPLAAQDWGRPTERLLVLGHRGRLYVLLSVLALILLFIDATWGGERIERLVAVHGPTAIEGTGCRGA